LDGVGKRSKRRKPRHVEDAGVLSAGKASGQKVVNQSRIFYMLDLMNRRTMAHCNTPRKKNLRESFRLPVPPPQLACEMQETAVLINFAIIIGALISFVIMLWIIGRVNSIASSLESAAKSLRQISESTIEIRHD
jgi:hypothetical protein